MEKEYQLILAELKLIRIELQSIWAVTLEFASKITFKSLSLPSSLRLAVTFSKASVRIFSKSIILFTPFWGQYNSLKIKFQKTS